MKQNEEDQVTTFDRERWQAAYLHWIVEDDISMRGAASKQHKELLVFRNSFIEPAIPSDHTTVASSAATTSTSPAFCGSC